MKKALEGIIFVLIAFCTIFLGFFLCSPEVNFGNYKNYFSLTISSLFIGVVVQWIITQLFRRQQESLQEGQELLSSWLSPHSMREEMWREKNRRIAAGNNCAPFIIQDITNQSVANPSTSCDASVDCASADTSSSCCDTGSV